MTKAAPLARWAMTDQRERDDRAENSDPAEPNADLVTEDTSDGRHRLEVLVSPVANSSPLTVSFLAKPRGRGRVIVEARDDRSGSNGVAIFNLRDAAVEHRSGDMEDATLDRQEEGWYRLACTMPYRTRTAVINVMLSDDKDAHSYPGDGHSGILVQDFEIAAAESHLPVITAAAEIATFAGA